MPLPFLAPGLQLAPFRGFDGLYVLVLIDAEGRLAGQWSVTCVGGTNAYTVAVLDRYVPEAPSDPGTFSSLELDDRGAFADPALLETSGTPLLPPGYMRAPWRPRVLADGTVLVAIDRHHRLIDSIEVPPDGDVDGALAFLRRVVAVSDPVFRARGAEVMGRTVDEFVLQRRLNTCDLEEAVAVCEHVGAPPALLDYLRSELEKGEIDADDHARIVGSEAPG